MESPVLIILTLFPTFRLQCGCREAFESEYKSEELLVGHLQHLLSTEYRSGNHYTTDTLESVPMHAFYEQFFKNVDNSFPLTVCLNDCNNQNSLIEWCGDQEGYFPIFRKGLYINLLSSFRNFLDGKSFHVSLMQTSGSWQVISILYHAYHTLWNVNWASSVVVYTCTHRKTTCIQLKVAYHSLGWNYNEI